VSTSRATGDSESLARSLQRSRELVVEPSELQRLPVTAMIVSHGAGAGRRVLLADANPAIGALPVATLDSLAEDGALDAAKPGNSAAAARLAFRPTAAGSATELTGPSRAGGPPPPAGRR
jgi:hypothetical protein